MDLVEAEISMVIDLCETNIRSKLELGLITDDEIPTKKEFMKMVTKVYRDSFRATKRHILKPVIDGCMESVFEERGLY